MLADAGEIEIDCSVWACDLIGMTNIARRTKKADERRRKEVEEGILVLQNKEMKRVSEKSQLLKYAKPPVALGCGQRVGLRSWAGPRPGAFHRLFLNSIITFRG
jgi:hypothetical protein